MKVLVTGITGQVGSDLLRSTPRDITVLAYSRRELDISDAGAVNRVIHAQQPDWIINAAAYTAVDKAESDGQAADAVNSGGAAALARAAASSGCRLCHISTDFVFDGRKNSPYLPADPVNPQGAYARTKADGERQVRELNGPRSVIVRTSWVYSVTGHNFVKTMLRLMAQGTDLRVVYDQVGSPTWSWNLALALWELVKRQAPAGIYHWADLGTASWYDLACAIQRLARARGLLQTDVRITPVRTTEYPTPASRPPYSVLDTSATRALLDRPGEHWHDALENMLSRYQDFMAAGG